jgi:hypothetical protein
MCRTPRTELDAKKLRWFPIFPVIPAKAGIQATIRNNSETCLGGRLRGHDGNCNLLLDAER